jgi:hypothetical protein
MSSEGRGAEEAEEEAAAESEEDAALACEEAAAESADDPDGGGAACAAGRFLPRPYSGMTFSRVTPALHTGHSPVPCWSHL